MTKYVTSKPIVLEGYQSVFEPNKFGKCTLQVVMDDEHIEALTAERPALIEWAKSKAKNRRVNVRLEPWEEVAKGKFKVRFSWNPDYPLPIVDSQGQPVEGALPLYSGSQVNIVFVQAAYAFPDSVGTLLRLRALQIVKLQAGINTDPVTPTREFAALFGTVPGGFDVSKEPSLVKPIPENQTHWSVLEAAKPGDAGS